MCGVKGINAGKSNWNYKHGETNTPLHRVWSHIKERCERVNHPYYKNYGGIGISVCDEWQDYLSFKKWALENGYDANLTIDRIDYNKGYEPSNCRWVDMKTQQNNKRSNRIVRYNGADYTLSQLSEKCGMNQTTLRERLNSGWSVERAVETPIRLRTRGYRQSKNAEMKGENDEQADC